MNELTGSTEWLAGLEADSGLRFRYAWQPDDPLLHEFYPAYDKSFVIDSEKELEQGFRDCLALNSGSAYGALSEKYGPYREFILVAYDKAGAIIGGANFICLTLQGLPDRITPVISINLNYIFILPGHRGNGHLRPLLKASSHLAVKALQQLTSGQAPDARPIIFFEQNDPVRMSVEDYEADSAQSGLDQIQRIAIWAKVGARIIDFPYVQPALSDEQEADHNLLFCVMGEGLGPTLDAGLLNAHLERFFQISVLKNKIDVADNPDAKKQLSSLEQSKQQGAALYLVDGKNWALNSAKLGREVIATAESLREILFAGELHMTVSVRLDRKVSGDVLKAIGNTRCLNKAVEPYFQDIADRNRHFIYSVNREAIIDPKGLVADRRADQCNDTQKVKNKSITARFRFPAQLKWQTEGKDMSADLSAEPRQEVELFVTARPFWYQHIDGALTFNLSFEIRYSRLMAHYYALSVIQKALFPTEGTEALSKKDSGLRVIAAGDPNAVFSFYEFIQRCLENEFPDLRNVDIREGKQCLLRVAYLFKDKGFFDALNRCNCDRDPGDIFTDQVDRTEYKAKELADVDCQSPRKGTLYFVSGFVRNVIDFFRQDSAEVTDGTDFHYPTLTSNTPEEIARELEGNSYLLYANDHSVYEFVAESRSLDSANDYIGICPYLFFVHMMALHNEALLKAYECRIKSLLDYLNENKTEITQGKTIKETVEKFDDIRLEILLGIEQFKHMNMLRYDTEQEFYAAISQIRGFEERQKYWDRQLEGLEKKTGDIRDRLQQESEDRHQQSEDRLNRLVLAIGFLSLFQLIFQATDVLKDITWPPKHDKGWPLFENAATSINIPFIGLALVVSLAMIGGAIYGLYKKDGAANLLERITKDRYKRLTAIMLTLCVLGSIGLFLTAYFF